MRRTHRKWLILVTLLALLMPGLAEDAAPTEKLADGTLDGVWVVTLENSYNRKSITLRLTHKDDRLRGHMIGKGFREQPFDGRIEDDNKIFIWSTYRDRAGFTIDTSFRGSATADTMEGTSRFFDKPYNFTAEKVKDLEKEEG